MSVKTGMGCWLDGSLPLPRTLQTMKSGFGKEKMLLVRPFASLVRVLAGVSVMRRTLVFVSILLLVGAPAAIARVDEPVPTGAATFVITGHGWGHGVGLSQYG